MEKIVQNAIDMAEQLKSKLHPDILAIRGMSSPKVRHFLNNLLAGAKEPRYLEVGIWQGSTFISAIYKNKLGKAVAIDNFCQFEATEEPFLANLEKFIAIDGESNKIQFMNIAFEKANLKKDKFNIYFYDGYHNEEDQYNAFKLMDKHLDDKFITIVDDWNVKRVEQGTRRAFGELKYNVVQEWVLPAAFNGDKEQWWNGIFVAVVEKQK